MIEVEIVGPTFWVSTSKILGWVEGMYYAGRVVSHLCVFSINAEE